MKLFSRVPLVAAVLLMIAGPAGAQTRMRVLNMVDVQRLVATNTPEAHVALSKHFMALAEEYAADAVRYNALVSAPSGNPNHVAPVTAAARRARQADDAMKRSEAARAMASYHQLRSLGAAPSLPADRAVFDGGAGARVPTAAEVAEAVASARTAADHRVLEEYFSTVAAETAADAREHAAMANSLRASGQRRGSELAAMHCDRLATQAREAAKSASAAALLHRQLASIG